MPIFVHETNPERTTTIARLRGRSNELREDSDRLARYSAVLRIRCRELSRFVVLLYETGTRVR